MTRVISIRTLLTLVLALALSACSDDTQTNPDGGAPHVPNDATQDGADADPGDGGDSLDDTNDADVGEEDADTDPPSSDADAGPDGSTDAETDTGECGDDESDCDYDGLLDCEEREIGTDVCNHDTDGDGLGDLQELLEGTDPLDPDTDGDSLKDGREIDLGLDPTKRQTWDDGIDDADRWMVTACENNPPEPVLYKTSGAISPDAGPSLNAGDWTVALPTQFSNYTELDIAGADASNRHAAAVYDDPTNEVAGFVFSQAHSTSQSPQDTLEQHKSVVESVAENDWDFIGSEFATHDFKTAAKADFRIITSQPRTATDVRNELLTSMASFSQSDLSGLPRASGASYDTFRLFVTVIRRDLPGGGSQMLTALAIAPNDKYETRERVKFRMSDLTNTTNIAVADTGPEAHCKLFKEMQTAMTDFYWVLDHSGSMHDQNGLMQDVAQEFFTKLDNTALDYRLGVTTMEDPQQGRLRSNAGWHTDLATFIGEVQWVIDKNGGYEGGLEEGMQGISYMKGLNGARPPQNERIRPGAELFVIWMTDDDEEFFQFTDQSSPAGQARLQTYVDFYREHATGFGIIENDQGCGTRPGDAYKPVVQATGGSIASVCSDDLTETIESIILAASAKEGLQLTDTPISSTLRVKINGEWVPRSREHGFDYFAESNTLAFFGDFRMDGSDDASKPSDRISVAYETFEQPPKNR